MADNHKYGGYYGQISNRHVYGQCVSYRTRHYTKPHSVVSNVIPGDVMSYPVMQYVVPSDVMSYPVIQYVVPDDAMSYPVM